MDKLIKYLWLLCLLNGTMVYGQKPSIDAQATEEWPAVSGRPLISDNGKYIAFTIRHEPAGKSTLKLISAKKDWQLLFINATASFTKNGNRAIVQQGDSLLLVTLGSDAVKTIGFGRSYRLLTNSGNEELLYKATASQALILFDPATGKTRNLSKALDYTVSPDGNTVAFTTADGRQTGLWLTNLSDENAQEIWKGNGNPRLIFNATGNRFAFIEGDTIEHKIIWEYRPGWPRAKTVNLQTASTLRIERLNRFNVKGDLLFAAVSEDDIKPTPASGARLTIWNYQDPQIQSAKLINNATPQEYQAVIDLNSGKITRLQFKNETISLFSSQNDGFGLIYKNNGGDVSEAYWNAAVRPRCYFLSVRTGERSEVPIDIYPGTAQLSPDGKSMICEEQSRKDFYCYQPETGSIVNITKILPVPETEAAEKYFVKGRGFSFAGWLDVHTVLINDRYDIWKVDLSNKLPPVNLTCGYGRQMQITFRLVNDLGPDGYISAKIASLLYAFNYENKDNGFYRMMPVGQTPQKTVMSPCFYTLPLQPYGGAPAFGGYLVKAAKADVYLVNREDKGISSNVFLTTDFKNFQEISSVHPEKDFSWPGAEHFQFQTADGKPTSGILYKPSGFDPTKKYPVIFYCYETFSDELHRYSPPELSHGEFNIPWAVSRGYVVVTPDIVYTIGEPGQSALNTVNGAVHYLRNYSWADTSRMGIAGHSFGGFEVNYIITHTSIFAAALSASAVSDNISLYGSIGIGRVRNQHYLERAQGGLGATLWEAPQRYILNSPVFNADKINTPVLLMNNKNDDRVDFSQGIGFFMALRRLQKKAWLLEYDDEGHILLNKQNRLDYTDKVMSFFDHYLKQESMPGWMKENN